MAKIYPVKSKLSLKENIQIVLPVMFDDLMAYKNDVITRPLAKDILHRMRIAGKPFRYAMEIGETAFGSEFSACLEEVKNTVELMGEIHDADVMIPEINSQLRETRLFNRTCTDPGQKISTKGLRSIIYELREKRKKMYEGLCQKLNEWESVYFRDRLLKVMGVESHEQYQTAGGI